MYLNAGELPPPTTPVNDGVLSAKDYADTPDANANGVVDPEDIIKRFSDGRDDDHNGYTDDISGWDFYDHQNDPATIDSAYDHANSQEKQAAAEADQRAKAAAESAARSKAEADWIRRIQSKVKGNVIVPSDLPGNPEAVFEVVQLPTGEIIDTRLVKSSGHRGYDDSVQRAILKSSPLPKPDRPELFQRSIRLTFRPLD